MSVVTSTAASMCRVRWDARLVIAAVVSRCRVWCDVCLVIAAVLSRCRAWLEVCLVLAAMFKPRREAAHSPPWGSANISVSQLSRL